MAERNSGPQAAAEGVVEDVKGKVKRAAGALTGNEDLEKEGKAQEEKASSERDVARKEADAERSRAEAEGHEAEQRARQS